MRALRLALLLGALGLGWGSSEDPSCPDACSCAFVEGRFETSCSRAKLTELPATLPSQSMVLRLDDNNFRSLTEPGRLFEMGLEGLVQLSVSHSRLEHLGPEFLDNLRSLEVLDLSRNFLRQPEENDESMVEGLDKLKRIDLSANRFTEVTSRMLQGAPLLEEILLDGNQISFIYQDAFAKLIRLRRVSLAGNELFRLLPDIFHRLPSLRLLSLSDNPWICDCLLRDLFAWERGRLLGTPPVCSAPQRLEGKSWAHLTTEDLACPPEILYPLDAPRRAVGNGSDVHLWCPVKGDPQPTVSWTLRAQGRAGGNGEALNDQVHGGRFSFSVRPRQLKPGAWDFGLRIASFRPSELGTYVCEAANAGGSVVEVFNVELETGPGAEAAEARAPGLLEGLGKGAWFGAAAAGLAVGLALCVGCAVRKRGDEGRRRAVAGAAGSTYVSVNGFSEAKAAEWGGGGGEWAGPEGWVPARWHNDAHDDSGYLDDAPFLAPAGVPQPHAAPYPHGAPAGLLQPSALPPKAPLALAEPPHPDPKLPLRETAL